MAIHLRYDDISTNTTTTTTSQHRTLSRRHVYWTIHDAWQEWLHRLRHRSSISTVNGSITATPTYTNSKEIKEVPWEFSVYSGKMLLRQ
jgi:hypothetical protein